MRALQNVKQIELDLEIPADWFFQRLANAQPPNTFHRSSKKTGKRLER